MPSYRWSSLKGKRSRSAARRCSASSTSSVAHRAGLFPPSLQWNYLSTLAVLQLDAILTNARVVSTVKSKENGNQKPFEKMIIMRYDCVGIGVVKMTVGVRRRTHEKVQYCITALEI